MCKLLAIRSALYTDRMEDQNVYRYIMGSWYLNPEHQRGETWKEIAIVPMAAPFFAVAKWFETMRRTIPLTKA